MFIGVLWFFAAISYLLLGWKLIVTAREFRRCELFHRHFVKFRDCLSWCWYVHLLSSHIACIVAWNSPTFILALGTFARSLSLQWILAHEGRYEASMTMIVFQMCGYRFFVILTLIAQEVVVVFFAWDVWTFHRSFSLLFLCCWAWNLSWEIDTLLPAFFIWLRILFCKILGHLNRSEYLVGIDLSSWCFIWASLTLYFPWIS